METDLKNLDLFYGLEGKEIRRIMEHPAWTKRIVRADGQIHLSAEPLRSLMILVSGKVESYVISSNGRQLRVGVREAPMLISPAMIYGRQPGVLSIRAVSESNILSIDRTHLSVLFNEYPAMLNNFLRICSERFLYLSKRMAFLSLHSIRKRLSLYLLELESERGSPFGLPTTMTDLAEFLGTERPSLSAVFHQMRRDGLFRLEDRRIIIDRPEDLERELD